MICHAIISSLSSQGCRRPTASPSQLLSFLLTHRPIGYQSTGASSSALLSAGLAPSIHKTYGAAMKRLHAFCAHFNIVSPFPVTEHFWQTRASLHRQAKESWQWYAACKYRWACQTLEIVLLALLKRVQALIAQREPNYSPDPS